MEKARGGEWTAALRGPLSSSPKKAPPPPVVPAPGWPPCSHSQAIQGGGGDGGHCGPQCWIGASSSKEVVQSQKPTNRAEKSLSPCHLKLAFCP